MQTQTNKTAFATKICGRCCGTGEHSYCQTKGRECFGCGGSGVVLTEKGKKAKAYFETLLCKPAAEIIPGDSIQTSSVVKRFAVVESVETINGETTIIYEGLPAGWPARKCPADSLIRIAATAEQKQKAIQKALEYQASL